MTNFAPINGYRPEITFEVELTVRSNAKCIMCPRDATPRRSDMELDTFKVVLDLGSCDYRKLWPLGSVHELSIAELAAKKACHKKEGLCGDYHEWDGLYGLSYDELEPLVHTQGAAQSLLESANRRGIVRPEQARQGHRAARVLNLRGDA